MRLNLIVLLTVVAIALIGCSGGGGTPLTPTIPGGDTTDFGDMGNLRVGTMPDGGNFLWGLWQGTIDLASSQVELTPLRQVEFHMNMASVLQDFTPGLSYQFKGFDMIEKAVDIDVTITHPFPNTDFRGFDVRGIFMGPGNTIISQSDPGIIYPALDGTRVLNADGYTRWWNAQEFTTAGKFGYDDPTVVPGFLIPEATLNPYKYFADCLSNDDPVVPNVNSGNRGTFSTEGNPPEVTRRYKIAFPTDGGYMKFLFHYAVDVSWANPVNGTPAPKPIEDFPPEANCPEAFHIEVDTTGSTAFYKDETESGGDLQLAIEVFDWQIADDPMGIAGQVESIWIESETMFDAYYSNGLTPVAGSQPNSGIYYITIPDVTPTGLEGQEILITVRAASPDNSYAPPMSGPAYPEGAMLAAYKLVDVPIKSIEPDALTVTSPNGGETWGISSSQNITWASYGEIENVNIDISLDGGENYTVNLATDVENDGEFEIGSVGNWPTVEARVRISNAINPDVYDESDENFSIQPYIRVEHPNGYEIIQAGASPVIEWTASDCISNVHIMFSQDSGENYLVTLTYSTPNDGSFIFANVPAEYIGDDNRIMIADAAHPQIFDESDDDFKIHPPLEDQIVVGNPAGGEEYIAGASVMITWIGDPNILNVGILLSLDSGQSWPEVITDSVPNADGQFEWGPIPLEFVGTGRMIQVYDLDDPTIFADSGLFTINEPGINLTAPNGGEVLEVGENFEITWSASDVITVVIIEMSQDSGATYPYEITASTPNTGSYMWDPINDWPETSQARIKISDVNNPGLFNDESDTDFSLMGRSVTLVSPLVGEEWRLGHAQAVEWNSTGDIPFVDITMSVDGGDYDEILIEDYSNTGLFEIASFFPDSMTQDHTLWIDFDRVISIKVEASDNPVFFDTSGGDIIVPIPLGIVDDKNEAASGDDDNDGVMDDVETFLEMNLESFDTDRDGMYDFKELFNPNGWDWSDLIPDLDNDGIIAPIDKDDNGDGKHDGELVDSDLDGIPNYLEYYGYTYNWLSGEFLLWDEDGIDPDFTVDYYKTDPMQPSSDQDPYSDGMETSGLFMDQSVEKPGNSPMVPACPDISITLEKYMVTLNADIMDSEGGSEAEGTTWNRETAQSSTNSTEHNWGVEIGASYQFGITGGVTLSASASYGGSVTSSNTSSSSTSTGESVTETWDWSSTRSTNPTEAAAIKLYLKVQNRGTACASNIIPTFTLIIGNHQVATFEQGNAQINLLPPGGVYPASDGVYWVVDSIDTGTGVSPIYLTLSELKALESGAEVTIEVTQMLASVAAMNDQGYWEYIGDWAEYMSRVDAVSANIFIDKGDGSPINYRVYADDDPSSPEVTLGDALIWAAGLREDGDSLIVDYKLADGSWDTLDLDGCRFMFDDATWIEIQNNLIGDTCMLVDVPLSPGCAIVGKMPPEPPLDKPQIHYAGYDAETGTIFANVSDYYAVSSVKSVLSGLPPPNPNPTFTSMTYDSNIGLYTHIVDPEAFVLNEGLDYIIAENIDGNSSDNFYLLEMVTPEELDLTPEPPVITDASFEIKEYKKFLRGEATATVTDSEYEITEVYIQDTVHSKYALMQLVGEGLYRGAFPIDPDYQPGFLQIVAYNTTDIDPAVVTLDPLSQIKYPPSTWTEFHNYIFWDSNEYYMLDFDRTSHWIQGHSTDLECDDDTDLVTYQDVDDIVTESVRLPFHPNPILKWRYFDSWDPYSVPSRAYIEYFVDNGEMHNSPSAKNVQSDHMFAWVTSDGRPVYMTINDPNGTVRVERGASYSLYNGPYSEINITKPIEGEMISTSVNELEILWHGLGGWDADKVKIRIFVNGDMTEFNNEDNDGVFIWDNGGSPFDTGEYAIIIYDQDQLSIKSTVEFFFV